MADADDVRRLPLLVAASEEMAAAAREIKALLKQALYRHPQVVEQTGRAKQVMRDLYRAYSTDPALMPPQHAERVPTEQAVADYIAGMTDRFAWREHARLRAGGSSASQDVV